MFSSNNNCSLKLLLSSIAVVQCQTSSWSPIWVNIFTFTWYRSFYSTMARLPRSLIIFLALLDNKKWNIRTGGGRFNVNNLHFWKPKITSFSIIPGSSEIWWHMEHPIHWHACMPSMVAYIDHWKRAGLGKSKKKS